MTQNIKKFYANLLRGIIGNEKVSLKPCILFIYDIDRRVLLFVANSNITNLNLHNLDEHFMLLICH